MRKSCCYTDVEQNIPTTGWSGYWAGTESKSRTWDTDIEEWVIYIYSRTLSFSAEKIDGEDYLCPTWHSNIQVSEECGNGFWHDFDPDVDFGGAIVGDGIQRQGEVGGQQFDCHTYPSDISY